MDVQNGLDMAELQSRVDRALEALENFDAVFGDRLHSISVCTENGLLAPIKMIDRIRLILKGLE
jgi:hypothetical protein